MIAEHIDKLKDLYRKTGVSWEWSLTQTISDESTVLGAARLISVVLIRPAALQISRYRLDDCVDIGAAARQVIDHVYREIILGENLEPMSLFRNPDDAKFIEWLAFWRAHPNEVYANSKGAVASFPRQVGRAS